MIAGARQYAKRQETWCRRVKMAEAAWSLASVQDESDYSFP
jgi:tRNA A37 N6-isopentenylltransferase MiaA